MIMDCNVLIGSWAYRRLPYGNAGSLLDALKRVGIGRAVAGSLDAVLYRNPAEGNETLFRAIERLRDFYTPAVTIDPTTFSWEQDLDTGLKAGCAVVRTYPQYQNWRLEDARACEFFAACVEENLPVLLTVEMEDPRQRHPMDRPAGWMGGELRNLIEAVPGLEVIVANARVDRVREVSLTLGEADRNRVWYDTSAIWGPHVDDLSACCREIGVSRFLFGSHAALKTPETAVTRVKLANLSGEERKRIFSENILNVMRRIEGPGT